MFLIILALSLMFISALCFWNKHVKPSSEWDAGGVIFGFLAICLVAVSVFVTCIAYSTQLSNFEDVKKFKNIEAIYKEKADALTVEFANHLAATYPEHEKEIYSKISPDKVALYFAKYPELKASDTLIELVKRINHLQSDVYDQQIKAEYIQKDIRFRLRNPWIFYWFMPTE